MTTAEIVQDEPVGNRQAVRALLHEALTDTAVERIVVRPALSDQDTPDVFFAAVLARLMIAERLDVEVAYAPGVATRATAIYGLPHGTAAFELAEHGHAQALPLIRDDAATVLVGSARHLGADGSRLHGETYVDDVRLFTGDTRGVVIEPIPQAPGLRARLERPAWRPGRGRWVSGRAAQTGGDNLVVEREGVLTDRAVKRSTFYRHHVDLRLVVP